MKFLCENCKAKYQIADDKVAGRTVRMKCRKCGHMIEVEASVTETSVAARMPQDPGGTSTGISASQGAVRAAAAGLPPPRPPGPPPRHSPALGSPIGVPLAPPAPRSPAKGAPRPGAGLAGAFSKAVSVPNEDPSSGSAA